MVTVPQIAAVVADEPEPYDTLPTELFAPSAPSAPSPVPCVGSAGGLVQAPSSLEPGTSPPGERAASHFMT